MLRFHAVFFLIFQFVSGSDDLIMDPENPSKSAADSLVKSVFNDTLSYSGFFNITHTTFDDRLFFWFFPHRNKKAPFIIWLQGQPGLSSLYGLFEEHGPYKIDYADMKLTRRKYSLTNNYHVLYLDPEIYCGFSYTDGPSHLHTSLDRIPTQIYKILDDFFHIFSEYRKNDLYIAGASALCQVICELARYDLNDISGSNTINLKGLIIGGGLFNPERSFHYLYTMHWNGIIDSDLANSEFRRKHHNILRFIQAKNLLSAMEEVGSVLSYLKRQGYHTTYDLRDPKSMVESLLPDFITSPEIRQALHVSNTPFHNATQFIIKDCFLPANELYSTIFSKYKILLYHGQFDLLSSYTQISEFLTHLTWSHMQEYYNAKKVNWIHNGTLLGYWSQAGTLTHVMIRNAGHFVGKSQPKSLLLLFDKFIGNKFV